MPVNDEFSVSEMAELGITEPAIKTPKAKAKAAIKTAPKAVVPEVEIDPELDRENWPKIHIEMEDGKPNYEYVAAHGTLRNGNSFGHELQIMRGVDVQVPPSIVYALQDAVSTHHVPRRNPADGRMKLERQNRSAIPWRMIKGGKHF